MNSFVFTRAPDVASALDAVHGNRAAKFLGGGTNLVDLMKEGVEAPEQLVDINRLPLGGIEEKEGGLRIGALARNSDVAAHALVRERYPLLAQALLSGASPQLRNLATVGGNLMQRTRCYYFCDADMPCNKRKPGSGCGALGGFNRIHAILGASDSCVAVHPSDMCVALAALDATVEVQGPKGTRKVPMVDFHRLPGDAPERDTQLAADELITAVMLPPSAAAAHSHYLKVRDRASYAFALVSVAVALEMDGGKISKARIALGGVAHKPWRIEGAEMLLVNGSTDESVFASAAEALLAGARPLRYNHFKVDLAHRAIVRALSTAVAGIEAK
ncbi:MAG: FAD-binding molybdopterin dehydrogenase [Verrucomicrobiaceae bacterium]|nr:FAD-binding molybdopterin dehydrogenase [Verrucomicrobiaceae bacterium]